MRARIAITLAVVLAACGDTLVDHRDLAIQEAPGGAFTCDDTTQVACGPEGAQVCRTEGVQFCGAGCADCTARQTPANAVPACLGPAAGQGACTFECTGGLLKCGESCCTTAALALGAAHTCAITSDARLLCWGRNAEGQVTGTATATPVLTPHEVFPGLVTAVAAGTAHTCATVDGQVHCIGDNSSGEAPATRLVNAAELAAGDRHTCARESNGRVTCWGAADVGQIGDGSPGGAPDGVPIGSGASAIAAGREHTCAVVAGDVRCWGSRQFGQLGDNLGTGSSATPIAVSGLSGIEVLAAAGNHTCATAQSPVASGNGTTALRCWGDAPGTPFVPNDVQTTPAIPMRGDGSQSLARLHVLRVAAGRTHTCFHEEGVGQVIQCFGRESGLGQLGGVPEPGRAVEISITAGATRLAAGGDHSCAVFEDGGLRCWGLNTSGQLGNGSAVNPGTANLVVVSGR